MSTVSDQVEKLKNRDYMENNIPKYVIFQSMCKSAEVLIKMRQYYKEEVGRTFKFEDSYQITKHELDHEENEIIFAYELNDSFKRFLTPELSERKEEHDEEIKKFGRFWLMEGFFNKKDKNLWVEAIDLLSTVNELVREDIRDKFIFPKEGMDNENSGLNSSQNSNNELNTSTLSKQGLKKKSSKNLNSKSSNTKLSIVRKNSKRQEIKGRGSKKKLSRKKTIKSIDSESKKLPENIFAFRPPKIWNYPYYRLFNLKHQNEGDNVITEIRNVDPTVCYKDNRIQKFMGLFNQIVDNMRNYWKTEKPNTWDYFFNKVLRALGITYVSYKMLKEEEEEQKRIQEENERKRKEEEENEKKQREMMAYLEKQTREENIEKKMEEDFKREQEELENKKEGKDICCPEAY